MLQVSEPSVGRSSPANRTVASPEWPTLLIALAIHAGWIAATLFHDRIPPLALAACGGWLIAWHGSLQHEAIHGHPTPWRRLNDALASAPLSLWLPYAVYRQSHLAHHASEHLTHPEHDPESRYLPDGVGWRQRLALASARVQSTLAGRLLLGPPLEVAQFLFIEFGRVVRDEPGARRIWAGHVAAVAVLVAWLHFACGLSLAKYLACFVYPGAALSLIRSFAEHRADTSPERRVAIVERAPIFGLLFLNNNLHAAHHRWPGVAWWRLPARFRAHRAELLAENGGLVYAGYREVFSRFLFRSHDAVLHSEAEAAR